jgi:hypothetical protein
MLSFVTFAFHDSFGGLIHPQPIEGEPSSPDRMTRMDGRDTCEHNASRCRVHKVIANQINVVAKTTTVQVSRQ